MTFAEYLGYPVLSEFCFVNIHLAAIIEEPGYSCISTMFSVGCNSSISSTFYCRYLTVFVCEHLLQMLMQSLANIHHEWDVAFPGWLAFVQLCSVQPFVLKSRAHTAILAMQLIQLLTGGEVKRESGCVQ